MPCDCVGRTGLRLPVTRNTPKHHYKAGSQAKPARGHSSRVMRVISLSGVNAMAPTQLFPQESVILAFKQASLPLRMVRRFSFPLGRGPGQCSRAIPPFETLATACGRPTSGCHESQGSPPASAEFRPFHRRTLSTVADTGAPALADREAPPVG